MTSLSLILGGLGLFLLGLDDSTRTFREEWGPRSRRLFGRMSRSTGASFLLGTVLSALSQSSTAATALTIGLVNAGVLSLAGAVVVMMGASVGPSLMTFLISVDVTSYAPLILGVAVFGERFTRGPFRQLSAVVRPGEATDIFTLSNIVKKAVLDHLAVYGFVFGDSRDVEIVRVVSPERNIDHVFGTGVQKLFERHSPEGKEKALSAIFPFLNGDDGMYASRALRFLSAAIRTPEETPFFCWQALDSLRMHFAAKNSLETLGESAQWDAFCEYTEVAPETLSAAASEARFRPGPFSEDDRLETFERTWNIVERYFGVSEL